MSVQELLEDKTYIYGLCKDSFRDMLTVTMTESFLSEPEFRPVIYKWHVEDTFQLFHKIYQIKKLKYYFNLQYANIKLISEIEMNNSLYFLDIKSVRENRKFTTSVYRKPTFSGVFSNFASFILNLYKYTLTFTLLHRAFELCSNFELSHQEIEN